MDLRGLAGTYSGTISPDSILFSQSPLPLYNVNAHHKKLYSLLHNNETIESIATSNRRPYDSSINNVPHSHNINTNTSNSLSKCTPHSLYASVINSCEPPLQHYTHYNLIEFIGNGSYGHVYKAVDLQTNQPVAIKKVINIFDNTAIAKSMLRELKILRILNNHCNIISLKCVLSPLDPLNFNDLYLVFDYMDTDMHKLIHSNQYFTNAQIQAFMYQILCAVKNIHSVGLLHRDIKPSNILMNENGSLKLCDFGMARHINPFEQVNCKMDNENEEKSQCKSITPTQILQRRLSKHVQTRYYRAPEIILLNGSYTSAIDMWSIGCILAELLSMQQESKCKVEDRKALFPGRSCFPLSASSDSCAFDSLGQLHLIFDIIGTPTTTDMECVPIFARPYLSTLKPKQPINLHERYSAADQLAIDLLSKLLCFDPNKRITAEQALNHPYLQSFQKDKVCETIVHKTLCFDFEFKDLTQLQIRELILQELMIDNPKLKEQINKLKPINTPSAPTDSSMNRTNHPTTPEVIPEAANLFVQRVPHISDNKHYVPCSHIVKSILASIQ